MSTVSYYLLHDEKIILHKVQPVIYIISVNFRCMSSQDKATYREYVFTKQEIIQATIQPDSQLTTIISQTKQDQTSMETKLTDGQVSNSG